MKRQMRWFAVALAAGFTLTCPGRAADALPTLSMDDEPEPTSVAPENPVASTTAKSAGVEASAEPVDDTADIDSAKEQGIAYLKDLAGKDVLGLFAPPVRHRVVVGWEEKKQNKDGSWGTNPLRRKFLPSSLRERIASLPARYGIPADATPCDLSVAHVPFGTEAEKKRMTMSRVYDFHTKVIATSYALLCLADPPAAGK
ncbi:MAG: hypothetical protein PHW08_04245 [Kiritimatiellae bacterium]|nr:hypothetical protein [Kiritimatiellia bacterium]